MAYSVVATILPIIPGFPQSSGDQGYATAIAVVGAHITRADTIIDGKISKRYSLPFTDTPPLIITISEDITTYFSYRSFFRQDNLNVLEDLELQKDYAMGLLDEIQKGEIDLVNTAGSVIPETTTVNQDSPDSTTKNNSSFFDIDDPLEWRFDDNLESDVDSNRD